MTLSTPFTAFRIHNDAAGYRSGIESIALDALNRRSGPVAFQFLKPGRLRGQAR